MRSIYSILSFVVSLTFLGSCSNSHKISDQEIEQRAFKIAQSFDSSKIEIFKTWNYWTRGGAGIWDRNSGDTNSYRCIFIKNENQMKLMVILYRYFTIDFAVKMTYDTSFWQISFVKDNSGSIRITGTDHNGKEISIKNKVSQNSIFPEEDPFIKFQELTKLKDTFYIVSSRYYKRLGGFIQFYLSSQHILTYLPDTSLLNPRFKSEWINEFSHGKYINKHWNLRKLDKPIGD